MAASFPRRARVVEVGPRDGLQNERGTIATDDKVRFIDALSETGLRAIEITSFVNPKWIPQLADGAEVSRRIERKPGVVYSALVPNKQGLDSAIAAGMKECAVFMSASETHNKKNVNKTIAATLKAFAETDFTDDLKKFDVPTLIMHGDDDQVVPIGISALVSSKIVKGATLKVYPGLPHGMCSTHKDLINADLLEFIKKEQSKSQGA